MPGHTKAKDLASRRRRLTRQRHGDCVSLSVVLAGDQPPNEFRIFTAGNVDTVKGKFVFDAAAAASVMAEYEAHGIDLMIDYDHASLGSMADPALAGRAAGWFNIEVRDGELWAVNVRWTPDAAEALQNKEWRFMSPAFTADESGRVTSLMNVAITNLPATRRLEPLMAASITALGANGMTVEEFMKVLKALGIDPSTPLDEAMAKIKGEQTDPDATTEDAPPPAGDGGADESTEVAASEGDAPPKDDKEAVAASITWLQRETGKTTLTGSIEEVKLWKASHVTLETERAKLAKERAAIELGQRKENVRKLIALGAETPATSGMASGKLVKRLIDEPLKEQTDRVSMLLAARGGKLPTSLKPPAGSSSDGSKEIDTPHGPVTVTASEIENCAQTGAKLEVYAANKAFHLKKRGSKE